MRSSAGVGERLVAEIDVQDHRVRLALLRKAHERLRVGRRRGGYLSARPMTGDMVGQPLQAFGVAAHHQQDWTGRSGIS